MSMSFIIDNQRRSEVQRARVIKMRDMENVTKPFEQKSHCNVAPHLIIPSIYGKKIRPIRNRFCSDIENLPQNIRGYANFLQDKRTS